MFAFHIIPLLLHTGLLTHSPHLLIQIIDIHRSYVLIGPQSTRTHIDALSGSHTRPVFPTSAWHPTAFPLLYFAVPFPLLSSFLLFHFHVLHCLPFGVAEVEI